MEPINVAATKTTVLAPGRYPWVILQNNSDTDIYVKLDGAPEALTTSNGLRLGPQVILPLTDPGQVGLFDNGIDAIHGSSGTKELRLQARKTG